QAARPARPAQTHRRSGSLREGLQAHRPAAPRTQRPCLPVVQEAMVVTDNTLLGSPLLVLRKARNATSVMKNPFEYGGVVSGNAFCNREKEVADLVRAMENNEKLFVF